MTNRIVTPIISIIIPVYNKHKYLSSAVKSVSCQELINSDDIEIIIVDDGSTDGSPVLPDELANCDDRIKVIHQQNQWIYASFNNGIREARGEYIYILNADDKIANKSLQLLIDAIKEYGYPDVIWTKIVCYIVDDEQNVVDIVKVNADIKENKYYDSIEEVRNNWFSIQKAAISQNQANLYKRSLAIAHPFRNDYYGADTLFNIGIADDVTSMAVLGDDIYYFYEYSSGNINESIGKFYEYEHEMFNLIYSECFGLYKRWRRLSLEIKDFLIEKRLHELSHEIKSMNSYNCNFTLEEKIEHVLNVCADPTIRELSRKVGREREYESRILNGISEIVRDNQVPEKLSFISCMLDALPLNYLDDVDIDKVDREGLNRAIYNKINKDRIGEVYYSTKWKT